MATRSKVLIVDDSALMRQLLTQILASDPEIEVVGTAPTLCCQRKDQVAESGRAHPGHRDAAHGWLTFLEKLMRGHPMPVVMISSFTSSGATTTLRALSLALLTMFPSQSGHYERHHRAS